MNNRHLRPGIYLFAAFLLVSLSACNSTPKRPPPPKPQTSAPPPPPQSNQKEQDDRISGAQREAEDQQDSQPPAAAEQAFSEPSESGAEVEVEEVALDGSPPGGKDTDKESGAEPGRTNPPPREPMARMDDEIARQQEARTGSGPDGGHNPELIGPNINLGVPTGSEQVKNLDKSLEERLAEFDRLMKQAEASAEEQNRGGGAISGQEDGRGGLIDGAPEKRGAGGSAASGTGLGATPDVSGETTGDPGRAAMVTVPAGTPDGRDDDIVARQLREAAIKETDPALKAKLWEEYRRYKSGF